METFESPSDSISLDDISSPEILKTLTLRGLVSVAGQVRQRLIDTIKETGGHLGSNLGVVELTIALHVCFDPPRDHLVWDTGHQTYPHKMLTGRLNRMSTLRKPGGLSGFSKRSESIYDCFGAGHASTALAAGLGLAQAARIKGENKYTVCILGDGALSAGITYEALNNISNLPRLIIVLNDNGMSISPSVGAISQHLERLKRSTTNRDGSADSSKCGNFFESLGLRYVGPVDGHDLDQLVEVLRQVREMSLREAVVLHVVTKKGKGYLPAEQSPDRGHSVVATVCALPLGQKKVSAPTYTQVFGKYLLALAQADERIVAITAAMSMGTGLESYKETLPSRFFDVGIAEQHAVTFAAGLACEGMRPFVAIYSTFLQRAYDQIIHDVAIQNLAVRFAIDRAGLVGPDGPTHAGAFDLAFLMCLPNMVVMAPSDERELVEMLVLAAGYDEGPIAFRYPRSNGVGVSLPNLSDVFNAEPMRIGSARLILEGSRVALFCLGTPLKEARRAASLLGEEHGVNCTLIDARFAKPFDEELVKKVVQEHEIICLLEDGARGGFCAHVLHYLARNDLVRSSQKVICLTLPDKFLEQEQIGSIYQRTSISHQKIYSTLVDALQKPSMCSTWNISRDREADQWVTGGTDQG